MLKVTFNLSNGATIERDKQKIADLIHQIFEQHLIFGSIKITEPQQNFDEAEIVEETEEQKVIQDGQATVKGQKEKASRRTRKGTTRAKGIQEAKAPGRE